MPRAVATCARSCAQAHNFTSHHSVALVQAKQRFNEIAEELTKLSTNFSNHVLDSTKAFSKLLTTQEEVDGLPASALALMAQQAKSKGHEEATAESGPWLVTLDIPSYLPVQVCPCHVHLHPLLHRWCSTATVACHRCFQAIACMHAPHSRVRNILEPQPSVPPHMQRRYSRPSSHSW